MASLESFELPQQLVLDEATATPLYGKFIAEPWENGFGVTVGNALRRVLLTSLEGVAVASVRIDGVLHEFSTVPDVVEDVMEIVLNVKKLKFRCVESLSMPHPIELKVSKRGVVTAADINGGGLVEVLNPDQVICTLDKDRELRIEFALDRGRGYRPSEDNKRDDQDVGTIPVDCLFSPIERVRYDVQACRVRQRTDYDRLELEVWTDGRIEPREAVTKAACILLEHLRVFAPGAIPDAPSDTLSEKERELLKLLSRNIKDLELSVRAQNCLSQAGVNYLGELVERTEAQMLKCRNFGKVTLEEIRNKMESLSCTTEDGASVAISLGMFLSENLKTELSKQISQQNQKNSEE